MSETFWLYLLVGLSISFSCASQVFQKFAANDLDNHSGSLLKLLFRPNVFLSFLFLGFGLLTWLMVISQMELSVAYPLLSIGYIVTLVIGQYLFKEIITPRRWIGTGLIILGVVALTGVTS